MADISITQDHKLTPKKAKAAAQKVADEMAEQFDMVTAWEGDILTFKRSGVNGTLTLLHKQAQLDITLGFLLKAFAAKIEEQVAKNMTQVFSGKA